MMPRPQFRLRSLFIVTAIVAVVVWAGQLIVRELFFESPDYWPPLVKESGMPAQEPGTD